MAATALIQLTQGATVGAAGEALFGAAGAGVDVANAVNTSVLSWQIELADVPPASVLTTGVKASSDNSTTPAYSFTPDVAGGYRLVLKVWNAINRVGTATDVDIRNFGVKGTGGLYRPTQQIWPRPLPPVASGETGNKPDENNFGGQTRGWAGTGSDGLLNEAIGRAESATTTSYVNGLISTEASARSSGDTAVAALVTAEAATRSSDIASEASTRSTADTARMLKASNLSDLTNVPTARSNLGVVVPDSQVFTANGTWNKPTGAYTFCRIIATGVGGPAGGGPKVAAATACSGGGAGGSAVEVDVTFLFSAMPTSAAVVIPTAPAGGAGAASAGAGATPAGVAAVEFGISTDATYLKVYSGGAGSGGAAGANSGGGGSAGWNGNGGNASGGNGGSSGSGGGQVGGTGANGASGMNGSGAGCTGSVGSANDGGTAICGPAGGGAGGGFWTDNSNKSGGSAGSSPGIMGNRSGGATGDATTLPAATRSGGGGGGGGSKTTTNGGNGADGQFPGGGGGGGGATQTGTRGGNGGAGGGGRVAVMCW